MSESVFELADRAEAIINPPGLGWQELFISRFVGALPAAITEVPRAFVLIPEAVDPAPDGSQLVSGSFEHSADGILFNNRSVVGTLDLTDRAFVLRDEDAGEQWVFAGSTLAQWPCHALAHHLRRTQDGGFFLGSRGHFRSAHLLSLALYG